MDWCKEAFDIVDDVNDVSIQRIFDLTGRAITTKNLPSGVYIIQRIEGTKVKTQKILIP